MLQAQNFISLCIWEEIIHVYTDMILDVRSKQIKLSLIQEECFCQIFISAGFLFLFSNWWEVWLQEKVNESLFHINDNVCWDTFIAHNTCYYVKTVHHGEFLNCLFCHGIFSHNCFDILGELKEPVSSWNFDILETMLLDPFQ